MKPPPSDRVRVLVVDDSAFARKVLRESLARDGRIEVVGTARDGLEALEQIAELAPDVITLDLMMPNLDGLGVLRALPAEGRPRVVMVSMSDAESELGVEALQIGAFDLVHKPTALATDRLYELGGELVAKVLAAGGARTPTAAAALIEPERSVIRSAVRLIVIGASTGGPQAITRLIGGLPADLPCAVAVAIHIPEGYTAALARRLDERCAIEVFEADEGSPLRPGTVAIAPGGLHLRVRDDGAGLVTHVDARPAEARFCPSVDVLFESAAALGPAVLGAVLTGMGNDGVAGARAITGAGGRVLTEAEASCIVYGMPRSVKEAGLSSGEAPIDELAAMILRNLG